MSGIPPVDWALMPRGLMSSPASIWRTDINDAPLDDNAEAMTANLVAQIEHGPYGGTAAFNVHEYNVSWVNVGHKAPPVDLAWTRWGHGMDGHELTEPGGPFTQVPIPDRARPAAGTDAAISIYRWTTDQLWDLWGFTGTSAKTGGRIDGVSTCPGWFPDHHGAGATSLASELGCVSITDARLGDIDHAISIALASCAEPGPHGTRISWPAQRSDGTSRDPNAIPEGTRLRLDPALDVDALGLHPIGAMIARAAQRYGFIVANTSRGVCVAAESGAAVAARDGVNPWTGPDGLLCGTSAGRVFRGFPWASVAPLPCNWGKD